MEINFGIRSYCQQQRVSRVALYVLPTKEMQEHHHLSGGLTLRPFPDGTRCPCRKIHGVSADFPNKWVHPSALEIVQVDLGNPLKFGLHAHTRHSIKI